MSEPPHYDPIRTYSSRLADTGEVARTECEDQPGDHWQVTMAHAHLQILKSWKDWIDTQDRAITGHVAQGQAIEILEAGCGRHWDLKLEGVDFRVVGIDLDASALSHRAQVIGDLAEGIVGDLCTFDFRQRQFDFVYSAFVLEHIPDPSLVMQKFVAWLRPGGRLILAIPDPHSVYGFVTRITPHWFHVLYYRYIYGFKDAGTPGFGPYTTYYRKLISRSGIREFCFQHGLKVVGEYGGSSGLPDQSWRRFLILSVKRILELLSLGRLSGRHDQLLFIIEKPATTS